MKEVFEKVTKIFLEDIILCDSCLGRLFGLRGYGLRNDERGYAIKTLLLMELYRVGEVVTNREIIKALASSGFKPAQDLALIVNVAFEEKECYICNGLTKKYSDLANQMVELTKEYEFKTFQIGCRIPPEIISREEDLWRLFSLHDAESIKNEITREVGKIFSTITGKEYDPRKPEMTIILDLEKNDMELIPAHLFVCGRYRKLARGLPQNPWLYEDSRIMYKTSIEELITEPLIVAANARDAKFHAAGREDIDALTLGNGRPFVVELRHPKKRTLDLQALEAEINDRAKGLVEVRDLHFCNSSMVSRLKKLAEIARKTYRVRVHFREPIDESKLEGLREQFKGVIVRQRTPIRVLHRRADKVRKKVVYDVKARKINEKIVEFVITCQGGLYVKEFIHGDQGRTKPSISEYLGSDIEKIELEIINIEEK